VGTLLVLGLLIAPPAAALPWARSVRGVMVLAAALGATATFGGLLLSWHLSTAAGATVSALAVSLFFLSHLASGFRHRRRASRAALPGRAATATAQAPMTRPNET
jgi:zinc/manganese transport system permease protein